jgi:hypothetical protein
VAPNAYHRGKRVSVSHAALLAAYERKYGRAVYVNQGRRTLAEQRWFYNNQPPLAAYPSPNAPHIKENHEHHALDINAGERVGQAQHVARFYRSLGVPVAFNVRGEPWHMDTLDEAALMRAARKAGGADSYPTLRRDQTGPSVVRLKKKLYEAGYRNFSGKRSSNRYNPYFSKWTELAVMRFQRRSGLHVDGVVGPSTWRKLK